MRKLRALLALAAPTLLLSAASTATAEAPASGGGFEVALHGSPWASPGRPLPLRGVAYEVEGLADLRPLGGAAIRARWRSEATDSPEGPWQRALAGPEGRFSLEVQVPAGAVGPGAVEVGVGAGGRERLVTAEVTLVSPFVVDLLTDRLLYQPGERVHLWVRVRDRDSLAPAAGEPVVATSPGAGFPVLRAETSEAGVAALAFDLPETAAEGRLDIGLRVGEGSAAATASRTVRVGRRHADRLLTEVEVLPEAAGPGEPVTIRVVVRAPSGAVVRGARVEARLGGVPAPGARTGRDGVAEIRARAPTFLSDETGTVPVSGTATHPAHGSVAFRARLRLAMPRALEVELAAPHGGLVPEVEGRLLVSLRDAAGDPPAAGTAVVVSGPAVRGGSFRGVTDAHGLLETPVRALRSAAAEQRGGRCAGLPATTLEVRVEGTVSRTAELCVPVLEQVMAAPWPDRLVVEPGDALRVTLARRPEVARAAIAVDLLGSTPRGLVLIASALAPGGAREVELRVPGDRAGLFWVRARPLGVPGASEGLGAATALLVRPASPTFPELEADREVYPVRGTAALTLRTAPAGPRTYVALLARDLAMHGGEAPFRRDFLAVELDRALVDPEADGAELLIAAALAAHATEDLAPALAPPLVDELGVQISDEWSAELARNRGDLRDPFAAADELRRRGLGPVMMALERALARCLEAGAAEDLVAGVGASRRFRPDALATALGADDPPALALSGEPVTAAMLETSGLGFSFETVARRVARARLVRLLLALNGELEGGDLGLGSVLSREPPERWLSRLVQSGALRAADLRDPWGGSFAVYPAGTAAVLTLDPEAPGFEVRSPGPDGRLGTADDVRDPFERVVPQGTSYAVASGEDALMRELALLAVGDEALARMLAAYGRLRPEAIEERVGDAAGAGPSEDAGDGLFLSGTGRGGGGTGMGTIGLGALGTMGHGGGTGYGSGFGRGAGRMGHMRSAAAGGGRGLGALIRERFPATLRFLAEVPVDPSGLTVLELPLADAATTYLVEAIVWRADGWTWSTSTRVRVDQDYVVDAAVPPVVTVGDRISMPIRISNRTGQDATARLAASAEPSLGMVVGEARAARVPAGDGREVTVELRAERPGRGLLTVSAETEDGRALDSSRRGSEVVEDSRRVREEVATVAVGEGSLVFEVPAGARPLGRSEVQIAVGAALFRQDGVPAIQLAWADALSGGRASEPAVAAAISELPARAGERGGPPLGRALAVLWAEPSAPEPRMEAALSELTRRLDRLAREAETTDRYGPADDLASLLLDLAPALRDPAARPALAGELRALGENLRELVGRTAPLRSDAPWLWAQAAAALLWTAPSSERARGTRARGTELLRRAERFVVRVGEDAWLEGGPDEPGERAAARTATLALAHLAVGQTRPAFELVRPLARADHEGAEPWPSTERPDPLARSLGRAAAGLLTAGSPTATAVLAVDGEERRVALRGGLATVPADALGRPGRHEVRIRPPAGSALLLRARVEYGLPWTEPPGEAGPFALALEGEHGRRDERAALVLVVRSRTPRLVRTPVVEVYLPAGAELDLEARRALSETTAGEPTLAGRVLTLRLRPLPPGREARVELPLTWTVAGTVRGLGVVAFASDRPAARSVLPTRPVELLGP